ncbi:MAG TPA: nucleoside hydrolase [Acidobacteriota bacterium]|nr:nucleoside hydrolase [Acidobacteriota bacterium]
MARGFWIDTDAGSDDVVALLMALRHSDAEVLGISVVSGNVPLPQGMRNTLYTVELCGEQAAVFAGAERPLMRRPVDAAFFHGRDGLGDRHYPPPAGQAARGHAVEALLSACRRHPGLTLVTLGPLTNVAQALLREPRMARNVGRCVIMGGAACTVGNVTPAAEYNMWVDPEAARIVFFSGLPIEMVGWELCRGEANLSEAEMEEIRALDTPLAHFALDCNEVAIRANRRQSGDIGLALPDPVAMSLALNPALGLRRSRHYVQVETQSELTRGMTVVDQLGVVSDERNRAAWEELLEGGPNAEVHWRLDIPGFKKLLKDSLQ